MAFIEAVGVTFLEGTDSNLLSISIRDLENRSENQCTNTAPLKTGENVKMVKQQAVVTGLDGDKPYTATAHDHVTGVFRRKPTLETLTRPQWVEATDTREAILHCRNSKRKQVFKIVFGHGRER